MNKQIGILILLTLNIIIRVDSLECYTTRDVINWEEQGTEAEYRPTTCSRIHNGCTKIVRTIAGSDKKTYLRRCETDCKERTLSNDYGERKIYCCKKDLCNGAISKLPLKILLIVSVLLLVNYFLN